MGTGRFQIGHTTDSETESSDGELQQPLEAPQRHRKRGESSRSRAGHTSAAHQSSSRSAQPPSSSRRRDREHREQPVASTSTNTTGQHRAAREPPLSTGHYPDQPTHAPRVPLLRVHAQGEEGHVNYSGATATESANDAWLSSSTRRREGRSATVSNPVQPFRAERTYAPPTLGVIQDLEVLSLDSKGRTRPEQIEHEPGMASRKERPATVYAGAMVSQFTTAGASSRRMVTTEEYDQAREREREARGIPIPRALGRRPEDTYIPQTTLYENMGITPSYEWEQEPKPPYTNQRDEGRHEDAEATARSSRRREKGKGREKEDDRGKERERERGWQSQQAEYDRDPYRLQYDYDTSGRHAAAHTGWDYNREARNERPRELLYDVPQFSPVKRCETCGQQYELRHEREHTRRCVRPPGGAGPRMARAENTSAGQRGAAGDYLTVGGTGHESASLRPREAQLPSAEQISFSTSMPPIQNRGRSGSSATQPMPPRQYGFNPVPNPAPKPNYGW